VRRIFLLSPAHSGGKRAALLFNERAQFDLAQRLRLKAVPIGEVFSFLSGLYFRGKLAYALAFARPPSNMPGALVITSNRGLLDVETPIDLRMLKALSTTDIDHEEPRYRKPLLKSACRIAELSGDDCEIVLLGSIATPKYVSVLSEVFPHRLKFPSEFVGRGDMSRGGLMLRCVEESRELTYVPINGATQHGARPDRLLPRPVRGAEAARS
jgi:hypothetical protein